MRSGIADARLGPFENLATNPLFARAVAGSTVVRRNLATRATAESFKPGNEAGLGFQNSRWGSNGTYSLVTGATDGPLVAPGVRLTTYARYTFTTTSIFGRGFEHGTNLELAGSPGLGGSLPVVAGRVYTLSSYFRVLGQGSVNMVGICVRFIAADGTWLGNGEWGTGVYAGTRDWVRPSVTVRAPAGAVAVSAFTVTTKGGAVNPVIGDTYDGTGLLVEERPALLPFFYAGMQDGSGIVYEHEGAANASPTVAKAAVVEVRRNIFPFPTMTLASRGVMVNATAGTGTGTGDGPAGVCPTYWRGTLTAANAQHGMDSTGNATIAATGRKVLSAYVRSSRDTTVALTAIASASSGQIPVSAPTFNLPANVWTRVHLITDIVNTGQLGVRIRTAANGQVGDTFDVTAVLIEETSVLAPYFDGYTTPDADLTPTWIGSEHSTQSLLYGVRPAGVATSSVSYRSYRGFGVGQSSIAMPPGQQQVAVQSSIPAVPGEVVAFRIRALLEQASPAAHYVGFRFWNGQTADYYVTMPTAVGEYVVTGWAVVPAGTTSVEFRLPSTVSRGAIKLNELLLVRGRYDGPFPDLDRLNWRGQVNGSTQVFYPRLTA